MEARNYAFNYKDVIINEHKNIRVRTLHTVNIGVNYNLLKIKPCPHVMG